MLKIFYTSGAFCSEDERSSVGRRLLSLALKQIDAQNGIEHERGIQISVGANGKPFIDGGEYFNISHTDKLIVCAISDMPVGIDAEKAREGLLNVARKILTDEENKEIRSLSYEEKQKLLLKRWVMNEAHAKLTGEGVAAILKAPLKIEKITDNLFKTGQGSYLHIYELNAHAVCVAAGYEKRADLNEVTMLA